MLICTTAEV